MVQALVSEASALANNAGVGGGTSLPLRLPEIFAEADRMVRGIAGRLHSRLPRGCGIDLSDLIQAGNLGLMQAARSFEAQHGIPLTGFAKLRIRGEMLDMVRRHAGREGASRRMNRTEQEQEGWEGRIPSSDCSPQEVLLRRQRFTIITEELRRLPVRDRMVVKLRYSREMTLRQIGTVLSVNESRACQLHQGALGRLKRALSSRGVRELSHL